MNLGGGKGRESAPAGHPQQLLDVGHTPSLGSQPLPQGGQRTQREKGGRLLAIGK